MITCNDIPVQSVKLLDNPGPITADVYDLYLATSPQFSVDASDLHWIDDVIDVRLMNDNVANGLFVSSSLLV